MAKTKRAASTPATRPAGISPAKVRGWSKRILDVRLGLDLVHPGTDVQLAQTKRSLAAQLEAVETEMGAALERDE